VIEVTTSAASLQVSTTDIVYREVDGETLLGKLYRPQGAGPFPAVVGVHGGAWISGNRNNNQVIDAALAAAGCVVLALDFRLAPNARYPSPIEDINVGTRWLKAHASEFGSRPDWVGMVAGSSGAHQGLLSAMRPRDVRYAAAVPGLDQFDASVSYLVACWPISDPLARYRMALERKNERLVQAHNEFFGSEEVMVEANPQLALERGENVNLPSLLVVQGTNDNNVTPDMAERLTSSWRARKGRAILETFSDQPHTFVTQSPDCAESLRAIELLKQFVLRRGI
jgi:acetyl esterase